MQEEYAVATHVNGKRFYVISEKRGLVVHDFNTRQAAETMAAILNQKLIPLHPPKAEPDRDFPFEEEIYRAYPRKLGKATGLVWLKRHVRSEESFERLKKALFNFTDYLKKERTEEKFIPHFSTWVRRYEDWVDLEKAPRSSVSDFSEIPF